MEAIFMKLIWGVISKLLTERLACTLFVEANRWWSDKTSNTYDDRVIDAMADALGVESTSLKSLVKEQAK